MPAGEAGETMVQISQEYLNELPDIYRDILRSYPIFNPQRKLGSGVALQSLYAVLHDKEWTPSQIRVACERMAEGGVLEIKDDIWTFPTELGRELIERLSEGELPEEKVPPFVPPTASAAVES